VTTTWEDIWKEANLRSRARDERDVLDIERHWSSIEELLSKTQFRRKEIMNFAKIREILRMNERLRSFHDEITREMRLTNGWITSRT